MSARHTRVPMVVIYVLKSGDEERRAVWYDGAKERDSEVAGYFRKVKEGHDEREEQKKKSGWGC